ncbi:ketosynthase chain-length factor [Streptomyces sp. NBC_01443]|uniref:ketosynthase chain-length factor n=1 Tax=Streptomyces sp. NBC_01443 TaxID=2903868 RepID=UPI00224F75B2|nr:ketosynthase chain-length factor [Streptomyces sp. NBC_01443]MCX4633240.1 ketosynthase chain-length factor [Streptomyces sp. NBC_01443]
MNTAVAAPAPAQAAPAVTGSRTAAPVVTGIGVAAPNGLGTEAWWSAVLRGESGIRPVSRFDASGYPAKLAGEVPGFVDADHVSSRLLPQTDRVTRLSLAAAKEALDDAGADPAQLPDYAAGVVTANSFGGFDFGQQELQALWSKGGQHVSAYQSFAWFYAVNSGQISIRHGLRGASGVIVSEQAGGLDAMAHARRQIRKGAELVVTGGIDSALCSWGWAAYLAGGGLTDREDPARAYLPFAEDASGHVAGEGGALLVLEGTEEARRRGARVYGTLAGHAATFDADGTSRLGAAAELALADAGVHPDEVDVVFADAAGERSADRAEAAAITALFGPRGVPVTAPKSMTGRLAAGGAALDVAAALLALRDQVIPPTTGTELPADDCPLNLVTGAASPALGMPLRTALVLARGHGGFNSAVVVRAAGA